MFHLSELIGILIKLPSFGRRFLRREVYPKSAVRPKNIESTEKQMVVEGFQKAAPIHKKLATIDWNLTVHFLFRLAVRYQLLLTTFTSTATSGTHYYTMLIFVICRIFYTEWWILI
jgi:hypothetical protein